MVADTVDRQTKKIKDNRIRIAVHSFPKPNANILKKKQGLNQSEPEWQQ